MMYDDIITGEIYFARYAGQEFVFRPEVFKKAHVTRKFSGDCLSLLTGEFHRNTFNGYSLIRLATEDARKMFLLASIK